MTQDQLQNPPPAAETDQPQASQAGGIEQGAAGNETPPAAESGATPAAPNTPDGEAGEAQTDAGEQTPDATAGGVETPSDGSPSIGAGAQTPDADSVVGKTHDEPAAMSEENQENAVRLDNVMAAFDAERWDSDDHGKLPFDGAIFKLFKGDVFLTSGTIAQLEQRAAEIKAQAA